MEKILNLSDEIIFHTAPTANRGDEVSVVGIARELASLFNREMKFKKAQAKQDSKVDFEVEIKDDDTLLLIRPSANVVP